jgi:hypothetical protein
VPKVNKQENKDYHENTKATKTRKKTTLSLRLLTFELLSSVNGERTTVNIFPFELSPFSFELPLASRPLPLAYDL